MRTRIYCTIAIGILASLTWAQGPKRDRGEGIYQASGSNTAGAGNVWLTLRGIGFVWANKSLDTALANASEKPGYFPFGEISSEIGIVNHASLLFESRLLSYTRNHWFQFGGLTAGAKVTLPDNKELRLHGLGLELKYIWNSPGDTFPSVAGYRVGATGMAPEGYIVDGGSAQIKCIYEVDCITLYSWLPVKITTNAGLRIPFKKGSYVASQFLFDSGILYTGLGFDVFAEYSLEAFNNLTGPKEFIGLGHPKMEVYFWENPMYLTLGGRVRYDNGVTLSACVPFLLSGNVGSAMTVTDKKLLNDARAPSDRFYAEHMLGITDPFDPWFAKWKIVAQASVPIFYKQTGSEMMRNFLLMKNRSEAQKIDIDEKILKFETKSDSMKIDESDRKKRLEDIQKRREQLDKTE
jgi:hypothetical protein